MASPPTQFAQLIISANDLTTSRYITLAAYCLLYYDLMLTFSTELSLIWTARWNLGKVLFFLNRYPILIEAGAWLAYYIDFSAHDHFCAIMSRSDTWVYILLTVPAQLIVMFRTIAIWNNSRRVRAVLVFAFGAALIAELVCNGLVMRTDKFVPVPIIKPIIGCMSGVQTGSPKLSIPAWGFQLFYDGLVFLLVLSRSIVKEGEVGRSRLMNVIFRDGCLYYFAMFASSVVNLVFFAALPTSRDGLLSAVPPMQLVCMTLIANRIVLNMRDAASDHIDFSSTGIGELEIHFAEWTVTRDVEDTLHTIPTSSTAGSSLNSKDLFKDSRLV